MSKIGLTTVLSAAVALAACTAAERPADAHSQAEPAASADAHATPVQLHQPRPGLYASGQPAQHEWAEIAERGITTVINLRTDAEMGERDAASEVRNAGMDYLELPIAGAEGITAENAEKLAELLQLARGDVLVQCASANRSGGLLAVMAAQQEGMDVEQALAFGRRAGMASSEARVRQVLGAQ